MATIDQAMAAAIVGVTTRRLQQLDKAGEGPKRDSKGRYIAAELGVWIRNRAVADLGMAGDGETYDLDAERGRLARAQAEARELANAELRKDLGLYSVWREELERFLIGIKSGLLSLPSKLAPLLDGDIVARRAILDQAVREQLAALATYQAGGGTGEEPAAAGNGRAAADAAEADDGERMGGSASRAQPRGKRKARALAN